MTDSVHPKEIINVSGVSVHLAGKLIQEAMRFSVVQGEFVALLGPNGAGKTTIFRLLLGLIPISSGNISLFGAAPKRGNRVIGYVPQNRSIEAMGRFRVKDIVGLGLDGHQWGIGWPSKRRNSLINASLEEVGALHLANKPFGELSGGEQQRALISQALLSDPKLLLLDEPFSNLDIAREAEIINILMQLCRSRSMTILLITHDINPLLKAVDSVLYLANTHCAKGNISQIITKEVLSSLYNAPVDVITNEERVFVTLI